MLGSFQSPGCQWSHDFVTNSGQCYFMLFHVISICSFVWDEFILVYPGLYICWRSISFQSSHKHTINNTHHYTNHFETILKLYWNHFETILKPFWTILKPFCSTDFHVRRWGKIMVRLLSASPGITGRAERWAAAWYPRIPYAARVVRCLQHLTARITVD